VILNYKLELLYQEHGFNLIPRPPEVGAVISGKKTDEL
jgi:hypothetical protein